MTRRAWILVFLNIALLALLFSRYQSNGGRCVRLPEGGTALYQTPGATRWSAFASGGLLYGELHPQRYVELADLPGGPFYLLARHITETRCIPAQGFEATALVKNGSEFTLRLADSSLPAADTPVTWTDDNSSPGTTSLFINPIHEGPGEFHILGGSGIEARVIRHGRKTIEIAFHSPRPLRLKRSWNKTGRTLIIQTSDAVVPEGGHIVLDPGHGGADPNACLGPLCEKTLALQAAHTLRRHLADAGYHVSLTREGDETVSLAQRVAQAEQNNADLLLSLHIDKAGISPNFTMRTYFWSWNSASIAQSIARIHNPLGKSYATRRALAVLKSAQVPSVLIELLDLAVPEQYRVLQDPEAFRLYVTAVSEHIIESLAKERDRGERK